MPSTKIASRLDFLSPLSKIPGLGPKRCEALALSEINNIGDLLYHLPRRYLDRSKIIPINEVSSYEDQYCCIKGEITRTRLERGRRARYRIQVTDETGSIEALWFNGVGFISKSLIKGKKILLCGKVAKYTGYQMTHPQSEIIDGRSGGPVSYMPVYKITNAMKDAGVKGGQLFKSIKWILDNLKHYPRVLPDSIENIKRFPSLSDCLQKIHLPDTLDGLDDYFQRLKYEELYRLTLNLRFSREGFKKEGRPLEPGTLLGKISSSLPFELTPEQLSAIKHLFSQSASPKRMHCLLQGDVGSGKTITAFLSTLPALNCGLQVAWLTPTEILAKQSFDQINQWLSKLNLKAQLLTGSTEKSKKYKIIQELRLGKINFIVGTHALLSNSIEFKQLGMIVIDEQHKFGSKQRLKIQEKDKKSDLLLMSATPIPKTLAETIYSDLTVTTIKGTPNKRQDIETHIVPENKRESMKDYLFKELSEKNSRLFWVVPRIDPVEDSLLELKDIDLTLKSLKYGALSTISAVSVHGKTQDIEKQHVMYEFKSGKSPILVCTTVVEVGIDVPEASIIIIENADRFGLSQLHQLRGRVGRGGQKSSCFLFASENMGEITKKRLTEFCKINDGFKLADLDLSLRGPGEVSGWRQSGWDELKIADILENADMFREINELISNNTKI